MSALELNRPARTYGNWRKPTSPGLFGLGSLGTGLMLLGLIAVIIVTMSAGLISGLFVFAAMALMLASLVTRDRHGKSFADRSSARIAWWSGQRRGAHLYRSGPLGMALWGTNQLPGLAAQLRLTEHTDSYDRPFALIHCPSTSTYTAVIGTEPDGASLVDPDQLNVWVSDWGLWLAMLADEPGVEAASVTIETAPDTGHRLHREVHTNMDPHAPEFARAMLTEVVERYPAGSSTIKASVAITFSSLSGSTGKKRTDLEMGRDLAARLPGLTASLSSTGAGAARPLAAASICEAVRVAYNPAAAVLIDQAHAAGQDTGLTWPNVGPTAAEASWDSYRHDDAHSVSWSMSTAPRGSVQSSVLARLLAPNREIDRKRVTLLYRPISPAKAAAIVESDLRAAEFVASAKTKPTARAILATRSASSTASEEASGAALLNFGMLVTATVSSKSRLPEARAAIDNLSATARLRLRPAYGSQDSCFAAALPLGLLLPKHLSVPIALKERL